MTRRLTIALCLLALGLVALASVSVWAADHAVTTGTTTVDCDVFDGGVAAGDTLTLDGGARGKLIVRDCIGAVGNRITIRNDTADTSPVQITGSVNFPFRCENCEHVTIDGTGGWVGMPGGAYCGTDTGGTDGCGIQIASTAGAASNVAFIDGTSKFVTITGIEFDCADIAGLGLQINDHDYDGHWPAEWREGFLITENYSHNCTTGEGLYIGPNWVDGGGVDDLRLRDIEISYNYVHDTGKECIDLKSVVSGVNVIHHNVVEKCALNPAGTNSGIMIYEGYASIHHNTIINSLGNGITCWNTYVPQSVENTYGPWSCVMQNNLIIEPQLSTGMRCGSNSGGIAVTDCQMRQNTIIGAGTYGASLSSGTSWTGSTVYENIIVDSGTADILGSGATVTNNKTGTVAARNFVNAGAGNYHLTASSDAVDAGSVAGCPTDDRDGVSRPQNGGTDNDCDIGAFEFEVEDPPPESSSHVQYVRGVVQ